MSTSKPDPVDAVELRRKAEATALTGTAVSDGALSPEARLTLLHELRVHQIELEMQNEELRAAHAALDAVRARYFDLYDLAPVGYVTVDGEGIIREANLTASMLLGKDRGALAGQLFSRFILKEDMDIHYLHRRALFGTGKAQTVDLRLLKRDGTPFWAHLEGMLAEGEEGASLCRVVIIDINDRRLQEEALRERVKELNCLQGIADLIAREDSEEKLLQGVLEMLPAAWFYPESACARIVLEGRHHQTGNFRETCWRQSAELRVGGRPLGTLELCYLEERPIRDEGPFLFEERHLLNLVAERLGSVVERLRVERENAELEGRLRQAEKMDSIGRLAGGVAHDFNNMLAVILGYTGMALEQANPSQPIHADLVEIRAAATRSADLTRQLLAFARKQIIAPRVLDLNETVTDMLGMLQRLTGENIQFLWRPKSGLWPVRMDPSQIAQILANLCANARDAISDTGRLILGTENCTVHAKQCAGHADFAPGDYVLLTVADDGSGMDEETLAHIFEPFFTTKEIGRGTGLGLATLYGIVRQNSGFVTVHSAVGQGTTFNIYLPRHAGEAGATPVKQTVKAPAGGTETILLVEDEPSLLKITAIALRKLGYTVLTAETPGAALQLAEEQGEAITLLITDVVMPEMNGRNLARKLQSLHPKVKRLFMSAYTDDVIAQQGVLDAETHFIQKPFTVQELADKVREALEEG